jgi:hypothetical protein
MSKSNNGKDWFLPEDQRKALASFLKDFREVVPVHLFVKPGENDAYADFARDLMKDLVRLSDRITLSLHSEDAQANEKFGVKRFPTLLIAPEKYSIRFTGAPAGEEGQAFLHALMMVSTGNSFLSQRSKELLQELQEPRLVKVFVSPTCRIVRGSASTPSRPPSRSRVWSAWSASRPERIPNMRRSTPWVPSRTRSTTRTVHRGHGVGTGLCAAAAYPQGGQGHGAGKPQRG